jgi:hypothetical protein
MSEYDRAAARFTDWLTGQVMADATGAAFSELDVAPVGKFWLGSLAPEEVARESSLGERADRVTPCELGFRFRLPADTETRRVRLSATGTSWSRTQAGQRRRDADDDSSSARWVKHATFTGTIEFELPEEDARLGRDELVAALERAGAHGLAAEVNVELRPGASGPEAVVTLVNVSPAPAAGLDTTLYEVSLELELGFDPPPYLLESLPSSFRYDRRVPVYGINTGIEVLAGRRFRTSDAVECVRRRPAYWDETNAGPPPDLRFATLADDPPGPTRQMVTAMRRWRDTMWSAPTLDTRAAEEGWDESLRASAEEAAREFDEEIARVEAGVQLLEDDASVRRAFALTNRTFELSAAGKYDAWRPFQVGFQLATLRGLLPDADERAVVDTLWFATGGGKTETYLGLVVAAAFLDRLRGKTSGLAGWARFPLRMLSLQQTQRFADVLAAAETVRREEGIGGEPFALGFLVGGTSTPNRFPAEPAPEEPDFRDTTTHQQYRVLIRCPFCRSDDLHVEFDRERWSLDHRCASSSCPWDGPLPFRVVDDEIFRTLPTVVVGTIDKTAGLGFQASMAGMYGPPYGRCGLPGHGFTYAPRAKRPTGCLVPGCEAPTEELGQDAELFGPTLRIQDELHLLRDSLGAMSAHYESALDHLQRLHGPSAKILASSATLAGYEQQVEVLYGRKGRVFPIPGPYHDRSFWSVPLDAPARRYLGLAPRSVTIDFAADRLVEALQRAVRRAVEAPEAVAEEADVAVEDLARLVSDYGTDVTYGSTLRDVEAAARSFETQIPIDGQLNAVTLTGRVPFETVREALQRLEDPEPSFDDRIHLVAASSMISHGVDVDRLNAMIMMGLPLTTAEFIQATARVGRTRPGLVFVLHKMLRERDAGVYRSFDLYVTHGDRLVEPVPITRRSRAVLRRTFPGLLMARHLGVHERRSFAEGLGALTTVRSWREAMERHVLDAEAEVGALIEMLRADEPLDEKLREDLHLYTEAVIEAVMDFATDERFPSQLLSRVLQGREPMTSLRDVDVPVPVYSRGRGGRRA